jgi:hypothetical protein
MFYLFSFDIYEIFIFFSYLLNMTDVEYFESIFTTLFIYKCFFSLFYNKHFN